MNQFILILILLFSWTAGMCRLRGEVRLSAGRLDSAGRPTLKLTGLDGTKTDLQRSTNLLHWESFYSTQGVLGELEYLDLEVTGRGAAFYRAMIGGIPVPETPIVSQIDSNRVAVGVFTMQEGGQIRLTNEGGVLYSFRVAPSNLLDPVAIRMRLITNLVDFPYSNSMRTAVQFEPEGFRFHGAGILEIQFPTNIPALAVSSFGFGPAGNDFHLHPDVTSPNSVRIPIAHFSVFGTAVWGPTERTRAFLARANNAEAALEHRSAEILGMERQRQMVGDSSHSSEVLGEYLQLHQDYFDRELKPQFEAAETDCSLFRSLLPRVLGIQRQQQLVGYAQDPPFMGTSTFQKARCNCFQELASACEEKNISSESFTRGLLGMERQAQLLGGSMDECGLGNVTDWISDAVNNRLPCLTEWIGKVTYSEKKSFTRQTLQTTPEGAVTTVTENETIEMQFEGGVERVELEDDSIPGLFTALTWDLHLNPDVTGSYSFRRESGASFVCKPNADGVKEELTVDSSAANGEGSSSVVVHFVFEEGELTAFTLRQPESFKLAVPGRLSMTRTECPKRNPVTGMLEEQSPRQIFDEATKSTHSFSVDYVPSSQVNLTRISEDELVGTATGIRLERALPTVPVTFVEVPYKWTFSLRRRK